MNEETNFFYVYFLLKKEKMVPNYNIKNHFGITLPNIFIPCIEFIGRELVKKFENSKNHLGILTH